MCQNLKILLEKNARKKEEEKEKKEVREFTIFGGFWGQNQYFL